jgi:hypothetical protein
MYEVSMNIRVSGTRNRLSEPREPTDANLTECLHRYVVFGQKRTRKHLFVTINNMMVQIIPREHNLICIEKN